MCILFSMEKLLICEKTRGVGTDEGTLVFYFTGLFFCMHIFCVFVYVRVCVSVYTCTHE